MFDASSAAMRCQAMPPWMFIHVTLWERPFVELAKVLALVRSGEFDPDSSRSGRWKRSAAAVIADVPVLCECCELSLKSGRIFLCACSRWVHVSDKCSQYCEHCQADYCIHCAIFGTHVCLSIPVALEDADEGDLSSEDDSDCEHAMMAVAEVEEILMADHAKDSFLEDS